MQTETIRVLICDDHAISRTGLVMMLDRESDITVVGEADNGQEAIDKAVELKPDVIILDMYMPHYNGLEVLEMVSRHSPSSKVLMFTVSEQDDHLIRAVRNGARGYLIKDAPIWEIVKAVRTVAASDNAFPPQIIDKLISSWNGHELSPREQEVLKLVGDGLSNTEIADHLCISKSTVRTYLDRLMEKVSLENRQQAIAYVLSNRQSQNS